MTHKKINRKRMIKIRLIILVLLCAGVLLGAWIVRGHLIHEPFRTNVRQAFLPPGREYLFGTDNLGRCVAWRWESSLLMQAELQIR